MLRAAVLTLALCCAGLLHAQTNNANRFAYLDSDDPFWPDLNSPKLGTPQWIGEDGVEAAIILAVDDMRDPAPYEKFLRPILDRLKQIDGRAPVSILTCQVVPDDPQLQAWLKEGLSLEVHTLKHPCPLLQGGNFQAAMETVDGCIDLLSLIPNNKPVAFRMPCCDSMNSPSPRFYSEIFPKPTSAGNFLAIDSSVMTLITPNDKSLPREIVLGKDGKERFRKYFPQNAAVLQPVPPATRKSLANFGTYIEDYPYPYIINRTCWEFPCMVPSDWEANNAHGPNNPVTVEDWKAALDATVLKQGVFTFIFHPHGWIKSEQMVEFIEYAQTKYGKRVKFLNFKEAADRLGKNVSKAEMKLATCPTRASEQPLPPGVSLTDAQGRDNGVRFVDLNGDGFDDIVFSNATAYGVYLFNAEENKGVDWRVGWTLVLREGKAGDANSLPPIVRADGTNNGVWFKHGAMWVQNEDTSELVDVVKRIPFQELLRPPGPPSRSPEESLKALHLKPGFRADLVAHEPLVQDPVWIDWGADGRMWVVEMADYPLGFDNHGKPGGRVKLLEDTDGDGIYDKASLFLDGLAYPTGLAAWKNGVFVLADGEVFFAEDTDGKGRADRRTSIFTGFAEGNPQHLANGFAWGLDGWFYGANGESGGKIKEVKSGREHDLSGRDFRFNPMTGEFHLTAGKSQYGRWRDDFDNWFGCNNSSLGWHYLMDERYLARNPKLAVPSLRRTLNHETDGAHIFPVSAPIRRFNWPDLVNTLTSGCNAMPYRDTFLGDEYAHSYFICEPANNLVHREVLEPDGLSFRSHRAVDEADREFLASEDNWSRFSMARTGPDGCLYVVDMYRQVIEHPEWIPAQMTEHLDLRAGADMGRIYRISPEGKPRRPVPRLATAETQELLSALGSPNGWVRDTAQQILTYRHSWAGNPPSSDDPRTAVQILWSRFTTKHLELEELLPALRHPDPRVRRQAVLLAEPHLENSALLGLVCDLASDPDPVVRIQVGLTLGESADPRVPKVLRALAKRDEGDADMLMALLTAVPKHATALASETKAWQAAFKNAAKNPRPKPVVQIVTNSDPDRDKVVKQYAGVANLNGQAAHGHVLYTVICAACHRLKNEGNEIGTDLGTVAGKPTEQIIEAIMDPSRAVEARYLAQTITLKDGREVVGMIAEETANSLTVKLAAGVEVILRSDISQRTSTTKSLMPDGLESLLKPQDVADVIAWIREK